MSHILFISFVDYVTFKLAELNAISINDNIGSIKFMTFADDSVIINPTINIIIHSKKVVDAFSQIYYKIKTHSNQ